MDITDAVADASLQSFIDLVDTGAGTAVLEVYSAAFADLLVSYDLIDPSFTAPEAGAAGFRKIVLDGVPIAGVGLAAAGAGTDAAKYRLRDKDATIVAEGNCGGVGSGQEVILSNVSIAEAQEVNLVSFSVKQAAAL